MNGFFNLLLTDSFNRKIFYHLLFLISDKSILAPFSLTPFSGEWNSFHVVLGFINHFISLWFPAPPTVLVK